MMFGHGINDNPWTAEPGALYGDDERVGGGVHGPGTGAVQRLLDSLRKLKEKKDDR
jgi:hypothetical protein